MAIDGVFVDSSVWIDFFADKDVPHVAHLDAALSRLPIVTGDVVLTELLQGLGNDAEADRVLRILRSRCRIYHVVGEHNAIAAAALYRHLRRQGTTVRKTVDLWIAAWCIQNRVPLLHNDRDFTRVADGGMGLDNYP